MLLFSIPLVDELIDQSYAIKLLFGKFYKLIYKYQTSFSTTRFKELTSSIHLLIAHYYLFIYQTSKQWLTSEEHRCGQEKAGNKVKELGSHQFQTLLEIIKLAQYIYARLWRLSFMEAGRRNYMEKH